MINWWTHVWQTYRLCHRRRCVRLHQEYRRGRPCHSRHPHRLYLFIDYVFIYILLMTDILATPKLPGTPSKPGSPGIPSRPSNPGLPGMLNSNECNQHFTNEIGNTKMCSIRILLTLLALSARWAPLYRPAPACQCHRDSLSHQVGQADRL